MVLEDAMTILSYASPYPVKLCLRKVAAMVSPESTDVIPYDAQNKSNTEHPVYRSQSLDDLRHIGKEGLLHPRRTFSEMKKSGYAPPQALDLEGGGLRKWAGKQDIVHEEELMAYTQSNTSLPDLKMNMPDLHQDIEAVENMKAGASIPQPIVTTAEVNTEGSFGADSKISMDDVHGPVLSTSDVVVSTAMPELPSSQPPAAGGNITLETGLKADVDLDSPSVVIEKPSLDMEGTSRELKLDAPDMSAGLPDVTATAAAGEIQLPKADVGITTTTDIQSGEVAIDSKALNIQAPTLSMDEPTASVSSVETYDFEAPKLDIDLSRDNVETRVSAAVLESVGGVKMDTPDLTLDTRDSALELSGPEVSATANTKEGSLDITDAAVKLSGDVGSDFSLDGSKSISLEGTTPEINMPSVDTQDVKLELSKPEATIKLGSLEAEADSFDVRISMPAVTGGILASDVDVGTFMGKGDLALETSGQEHKLNVDMPPLPSTLPPGVSTEGGTMGDVVIKPEVTAASQSVSLTEEGMKRPHDDQDVSPTVAGTVSVSQRKRLKSKEEDVDVISAALDSSQNQSNENELDMKGTNNNTILMKEDGSIPVEVPKAPDSQGMALEMEENQVRAVIRDYFGDKPALLEQFGFDDSEQGIEKALETRTITSDGKTITTTKEKLRSKDGTVVSATTVENTTEIVSGVDIGSGQDSGEVKVIRVRSRSVPSSSSSSRSNSPDPGERQRSQSQERKSSSPDITRRSSGGVTFDITASQFNDLPKDPPQAKSKAGPKGGIAYYVDIDEHGSPAHAVRPIIPKTDSSNDKRPELIRPQADETLTFRLSSSSGTTSEEHPGSSAIIVQEVSPPEVKVSKDSSDTRIILPTSMTEMNGDSDDSSKAPVLMSSDSEVTTFSETITVVRQSDPVIQANDSEA